MANSKYQVYKRPAKVDPTNQDFWTPIGKPKSNSQAITCRRWQDSKLNAGKDGTWEVFIVKITLDLVFMYDEDGLYRGLGTWEYARMKQETADWTWKAQ